MSDPLAPLSLKINTTSLPYFGVKLRCVCLMFAFIERKVMTYCEFCDPIVSYSHHKMTYPTAYSYPKVTSTYLHQPHLSNIWPLVE